MVKIRVEPLTDEEMKERGLNTWSIWEKEPSEFDWAYTSEEHCYVIEGRALITTDEEVVEIKKGDYVVFPIGLKCRWKVKESLIKYYNFPEHRSTNNRAM